ncbi:MAG: primosome assembly protein PriA [Ornithinimicrobium sp.]
MTKSGEEQLALVSATPHGRASRATEAGPLAEADPVARVVIDTPLAHLDRPFEYAVSAADEACAVPGARVRVRFAGRDHDGFVVSREKEAEHGGALTPIRRVVSPESVLTPHILRVSRAVADGYAGTLSDMLRLAIPPRHAQAEREVPLAQVGDRRANAGLPRTTGGASGQAWARYPAGTALLGRLAAGESPRASLLALPSLPEGLDWPDAIAQAVRATLASGRGSVIVVPDYRDVQRIADALEVELGADSFVTLTADLGPAARYRAWLSVLRGHHTVVVGTRSAAYAPVVNPGLFVVWDDADDAHREPRAPYAHVRDVVKARADDAFAAVLLAGHVRSAEVAAWVEKGDLRSVHAATSTVRDQMPVITVAGEGHEGARDAAASTARMPSLAWRAISRGLTRGPVLVQVPRRGYVLGLSCARCRHRLDCPSCHGPAQLAGPDEAPVCQWCGREVPPTACPECGAWQRRGAVRGEQRTAYEIGRAFPGVSVMSSKAGQVLPRVPDEPAIIVATPGAEPVAEQRYAATVLLDGWALLDRAGLDSAIEAYRRWAAAAALTRSRGEAGEVVLAGVPAHGDVRSVEALVRWDPQWLVGLELAERRDLALPPYSRTVVISGEPRAVAAATEQLRGPGGLEGSSVTTHGPLVDDAGVSRLVLRADRDDELLGMTRWLRARRSASKAADRLFIAVDPADLGG